MDLPAVWAVVEVMVVAAVVAVVVCRTTYS
jgi:hypothetical protein